MSALQIRRARRIHTIQQSKHARAILCVAAAAVSAGLYSSAQATTGTWTLNGLGNYNTSGNWSGGIIPNATDDIADFSTLDLAAINTVTLDVGVALGQITFGDTNTSTTGSWTIAGPNALTLAVTAGTPTITVNAMGTGSVATIAAGISGSQGLNKAGVGTLVYTGATAWSGGTTISDGTLQIGTGGAAVMGTGAVTNNGVLSVNSNALVLAADISGTGNLAKSGTGTLNLGGTNVYTGTSTVNGGLLQMGSGLAYSGLTNSTITVNSAGAISNSGASVTDSTFLSKIVSTSTGGLAIGATDAAAALDFTSGALLPYATMGLAADGAVTYTGVYTPAGGAYHFGGGNGTLTYNPAISSGSVQVGGGGVTILATNNSYSGTTTIDAGGTLQVGTGTADGAVGSGAITNNGQLTYLKTGSYTVANTISGTGNMNVGGVVGTMSITGSVNTGAVTVSQGANVPRLIVNGGTLTSSGLSSMGTNTATGGAFVLASGIANFNGGIRVGVTTAQDNSSVTVQGGTFTASNVTVTRNRATGAPGWVNGYVTTGGVSTIGSANIGTNNSNGDMSVEGGTLTVTGSVVLGQQATGGRGGALRVINASTIFNINDTTDGLVLGRPNVAVTPNNSQRAEATFTGGISTIGKVIIGDTNINASNQNFVINGGQVYIGAGGVEKRSSGAAVALWNLNSGTLGASADWSSTTNAANPTLSGSMITIRAADAGGTPHNITLSGALSGTGNFTKTGGGILNLQGANTYTSNPIVSEGTLRGKASSLRNTITTSSGTTVTFDDSTAATFAGTVTGTGAVTKEGTGLSLLNAAQSYTGSTTINGGTLGLRGTQGTSGVTVNSGGGVHAGAGGATVSALTFNTGSKLVANVGAGINTMTVTTSGAFAANGATTVDLGTVGLTPGTYTLVNYGGSIGGGGFSNFSLGPLPLRTAATLTNTGSLGVVIAADLPRWNGNLSADWDINGTSNWKEKFSNNTTNYLQPTAPGDSVEFNDSAVSNLNVNLTQTLQPTLVTVNNSTLGYTFSGSGKISGSTPLVKTGTNTLTIATSGHDYTGGTTINAGTILLGTTNALPTAGNITISGGTLDMGGNTQDLSGAFLLNGSVLTNGTMNKSGAAYDVRNGTITQTAALTGAVGLTKSGTGTVVLLGEGPHSYTGATVINDGVLQLGDGVNNGMVPTPFNIANNATLTFHPGSDQIYIGSITGQSATVIKEGTASLFVNNVNEGNTIINNGTVVAIGNATDPATYVPRLGRGGTLTINNGGTVLCQQYRALGLATANLPPTFVLNPGGTIKVDASSALTLYNGTFAGGTIDADPSFLALDLRGDYTVTANSSISVPNTVSVGLFNAVTFNVATGTTMDISSNLTGGTSIANTGPGVMVLTGTSTYSGVTSANSGGTIAANSAAALGDETQAGNGVALNSGTLQTDASFTTIRGISLGGPGTVNTNGNDVTFTGGITGAGGLTKAGNGTLTFGGIAAVAQTGANNSISGGTLIVDTTADSTINNLTGTGNLTKLNTANFTVRSLRVGGLTVENGHVTVQPRSFTGGNQTVILNSLSINPVAALDTNDNDLVVQNAAFADVQQLVLDGFSNVVDLGKTGIISTTGQNAGNTILALFDNNELGGAVTEWPPSSALTVGPTAIIGKYTYFGDANFDGQVTGDDYTIIDPNLNTVPTTGLAWLQGDMNFDGTITGDDYGIIDANLGAGVGNPLAATGMAAVPEPTMLGVTSMLAVGMLSRRRRRA